MPRIVCYNLFDKGAYIMDTNANIKDLKKVVKTLRIVWCFTLVFAVVFLALGINSLVTMGPFRENEAAALLPFGAAIAFTVIGAICAVATFFLTFLGFVVPGMSKIAPKVSGYMIDANKENIQNVFRTVKDAAAPTPEQDGETMFCHNCGQKIAKDSAFCKHCGAKQ